MKAEGAVNFNFDCTSQVCIIVGAVARSCCNVAATRWHLVAYIQAEVIEVEQRVSAQCRVMTCAISVQGNDLSYIGALRQASNW